MKILNLVSPLTIVASVFAISMAFGSDANDTEEMRVEAGLRARSQEEQLVIQQQRADEDDQMQLEADESDELSEELSAKIPAPQHAGAYHWINAVWTGDIFEMEDGAVWYTKGSDHNIVKTWLPGDSIFVKQNTSWFSSFLYRLENKTLGKSAAANLSYGPFYNGPYTHWIIAIDYYAGSLCLEDGTWWNVSALDSDLIWNWLPNDTVIIGMNDKWITWGNPHILINTNVNDYVRSSML